MRTWPGAPRFVAWLNARLVPLAYGYFAGLLLWTLLRLFFEDRWAWLFLLNSVALYLFLPLPFLLLAALLLRRRSLWLGLAMAMALWLAHYGELLLPNLATAEASDKTLTIMTYNAMTYNTDVTPVIQVLRNSGADIIGLAELNLELAASVSTDLAGLYPYQVLNPQPGVEGAGIISRYPLRLTGQRLPGEDWIGKPEILEIDFAGTPVTLLHFHAIAMGKTVSIPAFDWSLREREEQAKVVVDFVESRREPVIVLGDLNATDQNKAYRILASALSDAWREAGQGWGHTFPGVASHYSSRPVILGVPVPMWLVRIDYIFHDDHWRTESAWIGPWDGLSDHRPVIARLALVREGGS
jgi:endonuclease/exonuclease/phosphatase (EEP) superfamily protein YafD